MASECCLASINANINLEQRNHVTHSPYMAALGSPCPTHTILFRLVSICI